MAGEASVGGHGCEEGVEGEHQYGGQGREEKGGDDEYCQGLLEGGGGGDAVECALDVAVLVLVQQEGDEGAVELQQGGDECAAAGGS